MPDCLFVVTSPLLRERYGIREAAAPVYLMYYNNKLVYAAGHLGSFGGTKNDCLDQMKRSLEEGKRGRSLPTDFRFDSGGVAAVTTASQVVEQLSQTMRTLNASMGSRR